MNSRQSGTAMNRTSIAHRENGRAADTPGAGGAAVVPAAVGVAVAGEATNGLRAGVEEPDSDFGACFAELIGRDNRHERQSCRDNQDASATVS